MGTNEDLWRNESIGSLMEQDNYTFTTILCDFMHVRSRHNNLGWSCDLRECPAHKRHYRNSYEDEEKEKSLYFDQSKWNDIADKDIHIMQEFDKYHVFLNKH